MIWPSCAKYTCTFSRASSCTRTRARVTLMIHETRPTRTSTLVKLLVYISMIPRTICCAMMFVWQVRNIINFILNWGYFLIVITSKKNIKQFLLYDFKEVPCPVPEAKCFLDGLYAINWKTSILDPGVIHLNMHHTNVSGYNRHREHMQKGCADKKFA